MSWLRKDKDGPDKEVKEQYFNNFEQKITEAPFGAAVGTKDAELTSRINSHKSNTNKWQKKKNAHNSAKGKHMDIHTLQQLLQLHHSHSL